MELPVGVWSHVVVTRSGSTVSWYVNGALDTHKTFRRTPSDSPLPLLIGNGYANGYAGHIDEVAVYARALTSTEISEHYTAINDPTGYGALVLGDDPLSFWRLDETTGVVALDEQNLNPGTYQGSPLLREPGAMVDGTALGSVSGRVFVDEVGVPGIGGVRVQLRGAGVNGTFEPGGDDVFMAVVTAGDGSFVFPGLVAGPYRVGVLDSTVPSGLVLSTGADPTTLSLAAAENTTVNFGYQ